MLHSIHYLFNQFFFTFQHLQTTEVWFWLFFIRSYIYRNLCPFSFFYLSSNIEHFSLRVCSRKTCHPSSKALLRKKRLTHFQEGKVSKKEINNGKPKTYTFTLFNKIKDMIRVLALLLMVFFTLCVALGKRIELFPTYVFLYI